MNESNDNDNSNSEGIPEKKKKRKKHKKKKTITLDEFLNMNKDVFGEGLGDVQGIEEVPTQIVAKQLKPRKPPKIVIGSKITPTAEIAKLKKQGIVIRKKSNQQHQFEGVKVMHSKPVNLQNVRTNKKNPTVQKPKQFLSSSNDVLAKLQNSQIKIVKKGAQIPSTSETSRIETSKEAKVETEKTNSPNTSDTEETENATNKKSEQKEENFTHKEKENSSNKVKMSPKNTAVSNSQSPEHRNLTNPVEHGNQREEEEDESHVLINNKISEKNISEDQKVISQLSKPKINSTGAINALKNLSQHITIKPMSSPHSALNQQKSFNNCNDECQSSDVNQDHFEDELDITDNKVIEFPQGNSDKKSLNALIHLSHLTVKSVNQSKSASSVLVKKYLPDDRNSAEELDIENCINSSGINKPNKVIDTTREHNVDVQQESSKSLDVMKNISKHVTIKSLKPSPKSAKIITDKEYESDIDDQVDDDPDLDTNTQNGGCIFEKKYLNIRLPNSVTMKSLKSPAMKSQSANNSPNSTNRFIDNENHKTDKESPHKIDEATKQTCTNILKQLPNITAKPLNSIKNTQVTVNTPNQAMNMQKCNFVQKSIKKEETKEIEIFNIDDSDEEEVNNQNIKKNETQTTSTTNSLCKIKPNIYNQKLDALRNLNKNITIKSTNQLRSTAIENPKNLEDDESNQEYYSEHENEDAQIPVQRTTSLNNTLRHLGKHITVVSSSPKTSVSSGNTGTKIGNIKPEIEEYDSEPEVNLHEKITETDHESDNEFEDTIAIDRKAVAVRTPNSDSDHETDKSDNDEDIESQITTSILTRRFQDASGKPDCLSNLKNITIKSSKDVNFDDEESEDDSKMRNSEATPVVPKFGTQMSVKPFKQMKSDSESKSDIPINKNMKQQVLGRPSNQSVNKVSTSDQADAINKEVTIQTFQTKTVIQEITTTVTKTIRTVNQEVRNTNQSTTMIMPQRVQGIRPNQQINNPQGTQVRTMRPRIRNSAPANRPVVGSFVRSPNQGIPVRGSVTSSNQLVPYRPPMTMSNQLVPVRPGVTVRGPRTPVIRKPGPALSSGPPRPVFGKPLKISPTAMTSNKRPTSVETAGPFSCFKKPKDSPIPSFDDSDGSVHFASSSQTSRSNFSSITKTVADNSLITSSQMSSEVRASMQKISNLSNMSAIKVVRTSKAKQTMQVEEKSDVSATKRSALEAIERLQKQGLLVKKPRVEEHDIDQEPFDSGGDNDDDCYDNT